MTDQPTLEDLASAVWMTHGMVMNGGVLHAVEALESNELDTAIAGYQRFGFGDAANILSLARAIADPDRDAVEADFDRKYAAAVPDDESLEIAMNGVAPLPTAPTLPVVGIAAAIQEFVEQSKLSEELGQVPGKTRQQHRAHGRSETAVRKLLGVWDEGGHESLLALLHHGDATVRAAAAAYLCESDPESAIPVLESINEGPPSPARMTAFGVLFAIKRGGHQPLTRLRSTSA